MYPDGVLHILTTLGASRLISSHRLAVPCLDARRLLLLRSSAFTFARDLTHTLTLALVASIAHSLSSIHFTLLSVFLSPRKAA